MQNGRPLLIGANGRPILPTGASKTTALALELRRLASVPRPPTTGTVPAATVASILESHFSLFELCAAELNRLETENIRLTTQHVNDSRLLQEATDALEKQQRGLQS